MAKCDFYSELHARIAPWCLRMSAHDAYDIDDVGTRINHPVHVSNNVVLLSGIIRSVLVKFICIPWPRRDARYWAR